MDYLIKNLKPLISLPVLRTTGFRTFKECEYNWALSFLSPAHENRDTVSSRIGTTAHAIIEDMMRTIWENKICDVTKIENDWKKIPAGEREALSYYLEQLMELKPYDSKIEIEREFKITLKDVSIPIKGTMDMIVHLDYNKVMIIDHKTNRTLESKEYWQADIQPLVYAWAARRMFPNSKIIYRLGYINFKDVNLEWETDSEQDMYIEDFLHKSYLRMRTNDINRIWPKSINANCKWCPIYATCDEHDNAQSNLLETLNNKFAGPKNTAIKLEFVNNVLKIAQQIKDDLTSELIEEIKQKGPIKQAGIEFSITQNNERKLDSTKTIELLLRWIMNSNIEDEELKNIMENIPELFTVKIGGIEKLKKLSPSFIEQLEKIITIEKGNERIKKRPLRPDELAVTPAMNLAARDKDFG